MDIRICKQCGHELVEDSSFFSKFNTKSCPNCGTNDFIISPAPPNYRMADRSPVRNKDNIGQVGSPPVRKNRHLLLKILIGFFALIGIIDVATFLYYFFKALGFF